MGQRGVRGRGSVPGGTQQQWEVLLQEGYGGELQPVHLKQLGSAQPTIVLAPGYACGQPLGSPAQRLAAAARLAAVDSPAPGWPPAGLWSLSRLWGCSYLQHLQPYSAFQS